MSSIANENITSREYAALKGQCLSLIADLRNCQLKLDETYDKVQAMGLSARPQDKESELAYLGRVAAECTEREHDEMRAEELSRVREATTGERRYVSQPKSFLGRSFNKIAQVIG